MGCCGSIAWLPRIAVNQAGPILGGLTQAMHELDTKLREQRFGQQKPTSEVVWSGLCTTLEQSQVSAAIFPKKQWYTLKAKTTVNLVRSEKSFGTLVLRAL
jgi:hypothetical protein